MFHDRTTQRPPCTYVKPALVQWTLDFISLEKAVTKSRVAMSADVIGGEDLLTDAINSDIAPFQFDTGGVTLPRIR
jgi:hypothetical protein